MSRRAALWCGFALVHALVIVLGLVDGRAASWDVDQLYRWWAGTTIRGDAIPGVTMEWIYPPLALVPIVLAGFLGAVVDFTLAWGLLVAAADAVAFGILIGTARSRGRIAAALFWLAAILALGGVGMYRLDAVTVPLAILGCVWLIGRPWLASALLAAATWIKVWPAALLLAAMIAVRRRGAIIGGGAALSVVVVALALSAGGAAHLLGFVGDQASRGLQLEAPVSSVYVLLALAGSSGAAVYYDPDIVTFQVTGPNVDVVIALMTPLLVLVGAALAAVGAAKVARGARFVSLFPPLALSLVLALIAVNKVGSPQYMVWIIAPFVLALVIDRRAWAGPALLALVMTAATQVLFPWTYDALLALQPAAVALLLGRNLLEVVLFVWTVARLVAVPTAARVAAGDPRPASPEGHP